jgi:hypothetical protein
MAFLTNGARKINWEITEHEQKKNGMKNKYTKECKKK